jgi:uncharacterized phage protein (TIGR01671 family)
MREIKFRAWDKKEKRYLSQKEVNEFNLFYFFDWDGLDVQQFTGVKDKNEKEIWEGDIIKTPRGKTTIKYSYTYFSPLDDSGEYGWFASLVEVIGNIYENPELLK